MAFPRVADLRQAGPGIVSHLAVLPGVLRIIALGVDLVTIAAVAAALAAPPLALVLPVLAVLLLMGGKRRQAKKHEGLRVLR